MSKAYLAEPTPQGSHTSFCCSQTSEHEQTDEKGNGRQGKVPCSSPVHSQVLCCYQFSKTMSDHMIQKITKANSSIRCQENKIKKNKTKKNRLPNGNGSSATWATAHHRSLLTPLVPLYCWGHSVSILSRWWPEAASHASSRVMDAAITLQGFQ